MEGNLLYIVTRMDCPHGGAIINRRNCDLLKDICKERLVVYEFDYDFQQTKMQKIVNTLRGRLYGITSRHIQDVIRLIEQRHVDKVFVSYSLFGCFSKAIKKRYPEIEVITFFHNVEYEYAKGEYLAKQVFKYKLLIYIAKRLERMSVNCSDRIIALNRRDGKRIKQLYGREVDLILPTTFKDKWRGVTTKEEKGPHVPLRLLFVGFNFYANVQGVDWFVKNVMNGLSGAVLYIVGKGMEKERERWASGNVVVVGTVENLDEWYEMADVVVLPIFLGSGMKTKTAEALMYGKPILGTTEAFEGYDFDAFLVGALCNDVSSFISNIIEIQNNMTWVVEKGWQARRLFEEKYTYETSLRKLEFFLAYGK